MRPVPVDKFAHADTVIGFDGKRHAKNGFDENEKEQCP
jgi:hypothetical protein